MSKQSDILVIGGAAKSLRHGMLALSLLLALPPAFAQDSPQQDAKDEPVPRSILERKRLISGNSGSGGIFIPDLSVRDFLASYNSEDPEEQIVAYAFLLGLSDATEGKVWCGYYRFKSITVLEIIHSELEKLDSSRYDERATDVIADILGKRHPCKKGG